MTRRLLAVSLFLALAAAVSCAQDEPARAAITHGPVIESMTANSGVVAWSTNVSAGTVVKYGSDPDHLTMTAEMPWGGYTHRAMLRNLRPDTTYYFQASSPAAQGSGANLLSEVQEFHTPPGNGISPAAAQDNASNQN